MILTRDTRIVSQRRERVLKASKDAEGAEKALNTQDL
jgi:hypothetical protein